MASWLDLWRCFAGLRRPHNSRFRVVHRNKDGKLANPLGGAARTKLHGR